MGFTAEAERELASAGELGGYTPLCRINKEEEQRLLWELYYLVCLLTFSELCYLQKFPSRKLLARKTEKKENTRGLEKWRKM